MLHQEAETYAAKVMRNFIFALTGDRPELWGEKEGHGLSYRAAASHRMIPVPIKSWEGLKS
jgi:hypothetical protein